MHLYYVCGCCVGVWSSGNLLRVVRQGGDARPGPEEGPGAAPQEEQTRARKQGHMRTRQEALLLRIQEVSHVHIQTVAVQETRCHSH